MKAWLAFWMDGKTRRSKTFSSKLFGFDEARVAAVAFLQSHKRERAMDILNYPQDVSVPCTPPLPCGLADASPSEGSTAISSRPSESSSFNSQENVCLGEVVR